MTTTFYGGDPWPRITAVCRRRGPRRAAIAYLGADGPRLLPLRSGDTLVVNAGDATLSSRGTSPDALQVYLDRDVNLYSHENLHAKVLATAGWALVGSANASQNSTTLQEAVLVTDDATVVRETAAFVDELVDGGSTEITPEFLERARRVWDAGRYTGPPGRDGPVVGGPSPDDGFVSATVTRVFLQRLEEVEVTDRLWETVQGHRGPARRAAGRAGRYRLEPVLLARAQAAEYRPRDILISVSTDADGTLWLTPAQVIGDAVAVPRTRDAIRWLRYDRTLEPVEVQDARERLRAAGLRNPRLPGGDRQVRSVALRTALLGLWTD